MHKALLIYVCSLLLLGGCAFLVGEGELTRSDKFDHWRDRVSRQGW